MRRAGALATRPVTGNERAGAGRGRADGARRARRTGGPAISPRCSRARSRRSPRRPGRAASPPGDATRSGALRVLAARVEGAAAPSAERGGVARRRPRSRARPSSTGSASAALAKLAAEHGFLAAAPLREGAGEPLALLLVGRRRPPGAVRPRLLAALGAAAAKSLRPGGRRQRRTQRLARLDGEVQRIDRLAAVGGLLAEIVHEIRNPLVSIKTFLHLLGEEKDARPGRVPRRGDRGAAPDRAPARGREPARAAALDAERRRDRASSSPRSARWRSSPRCAPSAAASRSRSSSRSALPPARIAGDALRQILLNLALNAIEAAPDGRARAHLARPASGERVEFALEDDGPGVPEELRRASLRAVLLDQGAARAGSGSRSRAGSSRTPGGTIELEAARTDRLALLREAAARARLARRHRRAAIRARRRPISASPSRKK